MDLAGRNENNGNDCWETVISPEGRQAVTDETRQRLEKMSREQREERFQELLQKHGILNPTALPRSGEPPKVILLEEAEERVWLKKNLGYN
jgi:hypothetical protein